MEAGYGKSTSMSHWWIHKMLGSIIIQTREGTWGLGGLTSALEQILRWPLQWWVNKHFPEDTGCASHFLQWPSILWSGIRVSRVLNLSFYCCVILQLSVGPNLHFSLKNIWSHISAFVKVLVDRLVVVGSPVTHLRKRSWHLSYWWKNDYYTCAFSLLFI